MVISRLLVAGRQAGLMLLGLGFMWTCLPVLAQSVNADDPSARVARLAELTGPAWLYSPDTAEWESAKRNRPLTTGNRLTTEPGVRAELQVGSTVIRLDAATELEVAQLDDKEMVLRLHTGTLSARVRSVADAGTLTVTTDEGRFTLQRVGRYRLERDPASSHLNVDTGQAIFQGEDTTLTVHSGQRASVGRRADNSIITSLNSPSSDEFAHWNRERDRISDQQAAPRQVSPEMPGVDELERYGRWHESTEYGVLWIPHSLSAGWAPYSQGHWVHMRPWGWTWVDDAPWGFAPFHYGRWVHWRHGWAWAPGTRVVRPVYAPALVAWVGGPGLSLSMSINGPTSAPVGWVPLAPREVFVPSYRVSPGYVRNINITHVPRGHDIHRAVQQPQAPRELRHWGRHPHAAPAVHSNVIHTQPPVVPAASPSGRSPWGHEPHRQPARHPHGSVWPASQSTLQTPAVTVVSPRQATPQVREVQLPDMRRPEPPSRQRSQEFRNSRSEAQEPRGSESRRGASERGQ